MAAGKKNTQPPPQTPSPQPPQGVKRRTKGTADNKLLLPDARWQRFQRYVWDKKKG
ncbi:MAG: hypothetical protein WBP72_07265 [Rhodocyclaceae bacterium]